jgi:hypothetical protein
MVHVAASSTSPSNARKSYSGGSVSEHCINSPFVSPSTSKLASESEPPLPLPPHSILSDPLMAFTLWKHAHLFCIATAINVSRLKALICHLNHPLSMSCGRLSYCHTVYASNTASDVPALARRLKPAKAGHEKPGQARLSAWLSKACGSGFDS